MSGIRKPVVGGNWKMNLGGAEAEALTSSLIDRVAASDAVEVIIFPPFVYLERVGRLLRDERSPIKLGAQDVYPEPNGAFTGEISCAMLKDVGAQVVLTGHSERRHVIGEPDTLINAKTVAALEAGFEVVLCVGEKIEQRKANKTDAVNIAQTLAGLAGVPHSHLDRLTIAYEPVWAIGTGMTATPADAQSAHTAIRQALAHLVDPDFAAETRIQYGGSVKPDNAAELFSQPDIDGGLIGGASLKPNDFMAIIEAAKSCA